ncbi:MAG: hypothetical protein IPH82_29495 [Chloroflexi bacterium]|nr:hypothetical protein [Chloroflexota bacterium]
MMVVLVGDWSIIVSGMNENHLYGTPGAGGGGPMGNLGPTVISLQQISSNQSNPVALNIMIIGIIMLVILSFGAIGYRRRNR